MTERKELVVFIPGMGVDEPELYLERLMTGLREFCAGRGTPLRSIQDSGEQGSGRRSVEISGDDGRTTTFDIQEVFWGDLRPRLSLEPVHKRVIRGFGLLAFWLASLKSLRVATHSSYMLTNVVSTTVLILIWYYGAVMAGLTAIGSHQEFFGTNLTGIFGEIATGLGEFGKSMGGWSIWLVASVFVGILPTTQVIDIAYATKHYLQNRHGIRQKARGRVAAAVAKGARSGEYARITVLAHSFGVVIGTEVLADYAPAASPRIRFISLGGPLLLVKARAERIGLAIGRTMANEHLDSWLDFYSEQDWLCTKSPVPPDAEIYRGQEIAGTVPLDERISGASHDLYFDEPEVLETLLTK